MVCTIPAHSKHLHHALTPMRTSDSPSPEPESYTPVPELPEFIEGSSRGTHDVDNLARRLYTTASFDDKDSMWAQEGGEKWSF